MISGNKFTNCNKIKCCLLSIVFCLTIFKLGYINCDIWVCHTIFSLFHVFISFVLLACNSQTICKHLRQIINLVN